MIRQELVQSVINDIADSAASSLVDAMGGLGSNKSWNGLNSKLLATIFPISKGEGGAWSRVAGKAVIVPFSESNLDMTLNWQSPFEQSGPEAKAPALMAMLQSGALQPLISAVLGTESESKSSSDVNSAIKEFEGRTGITKLNSTQIFSGMPPIKITATAVFRAWADPKKEVEELLDQLMTWALPEELSNEETLLTRAIEEAKGSGQGVIHALLPSKAPIRVGLTYKNRTYMPLVIESISFPLDSPIDKSGNMVECSVQITFATLTAIDGKDWMALKG